MPFFLRTAQKKRDCLLAVSRGAENEARTRDPNLGKVVLYQLSYFRILYVKELLAKVVNLISLRQGCALPTELFPHTLC